MQLRNLISQSSVPFIILGILLLLFVLSSISSRTRRTRTVNKKAPPEAGGAWPLIGHLHLLGGSQAPHVTLGNMADKYGPVFTIRLGVHQTLIVSNSEMAKDCFTVNDKAFANRPKALALEILGFNFSMVGFSQYSSYWRLMRKITTVELLSAQSIKLFKHVMESEVKVAIKESYEKSNKATELKNWFGDLTRNLMFRILVGKRFVDNNEDWKIRIKKAFREVIELSGTIVISDAVPYLRWLDLDGKEKEMKKTAKELDELAQVWLDEHKNKRKRDWNGGSAGEGQGKQNDFMDVLLSLVEKGEDFQGRDADTTIKATCLAMLIAGTDPTTGTLTWALSLLLNNKEALNKAIDELDTKIGRDRLPVESDLKNLTYLHAIIKETLRLYPPGPLNLPHESMEECVVGGYHVPAGTVLLTNISKIQRDPLVYQDPLEFRPERFLTINKDVDLRGHHFELIPFGAGRRMCSGLSLALQIMQLTLANLLHGFDITTLDGGQVDMAELVGLITVKASPLHVILTPRLSPQVYTY